MILLTSLSCLAALLLLGVVAVNLVRIVDALDSIGGAPTSSLAKIRFGLRAIETETAGLRPQVTRLNEGFTALDRGLREVDRDLSAALSRTEGGEG